MGILENGSSSARYGVVVEYFVKSSSHRWTAIPRLLGMATTSCPGLIWESF
jgi:hypothetical protein